MSDTRSKLLDAAERLFAAHGFGAVSLRQIIANAEVNVAAVHYHFGSKDELLDAVVMRKVAAVNEHRMARLVRMEAEANGKLKIEKVLEAFLAPMADVARVNPAFAQMMGRLQAEGVLSAVFIRNSQPVLGRFLGMLRICVPHISDAEFTWRVHFAQGAIATAMCGERSSVAGSVENESYASRIDRLIAFLGAGMAAPASRIDRAARHETDDVLPGVAKKAVRRQGKG